MSKILEPTLYLLANPSFLSVVSVPLLHLQQLLLQPLLLLLLLPSRQRFLLRFRPPPLAGVVPAVHRQIAESSMEV
jgi:hypothetical protein